MIENIKFGQCPGQLRQARAAASEAEVSQEDQVVAVSRSVSSCTSAAISLSFRLEIAPVVDAEEQFTAFPKGDAQTPVRRDDASGASVGTVVTSPLLQLDELSYQGHKPGCTTRVVRSSKRQVSEDLQELRGPRGWQKGSTRREDQDITEFCEDITERVHGRRGLRRGRGNGSAMKESCRSRTSWD